MTRTSRIVLLVLSALLVLVGCSESSTAPSDAGDSSTPRADAGGSSLPGDASCEERSEAFSAFVAAHNDCNVAADCTVIGDCGPNADFTSVRVDAYVVAHGLQVARCPGAWDGPMFTAVCTENKCGLAVRKDTCCGCLPIDADASVDDGG